MKGRKCTPRDEVPEIGQFAAIMTYFGYGLLIFAGHMRDFFRSMFCTKKEKSIIDEQYVPLLHDWEDFYTRRLYKRIHDCWNRPVTTCPGAWMDVVLRKGTKQGGPLQITGEVRRCLNLGSYNYLGFGDPDSPTKPQVFSTLNKYSVATCSFRSAIGTTLLHQELETLVARYIGKPAAMVFAMGFGTNSVGIPALASGKGCLIISDSNNHSSIVAGARTSGAKIKVFNHNDAEHLEVVVRRAIVDGQARTHRPWSKIIILVEGIYSMEGEMSPLSDIVAIKKKYGCYLYVDEAHSVGALGKSGRGICEYMGVDTSDIDVLMGTFTKSFGAVGGYIAASHDIIHFLKRSSMGSMYSCGISPPATQQIISAMKIIMGEDGTHIGQEKLHSLRDNSNFFRQRLKEMGCHVLGDWDSPIVPVMLYNPSKIPAFSRECFERGLAVVVVGFPAAPLLLSRTRFCISAAHTKKDLEEALVKIEEVCEEIGIKYGTPMCGLIH